jgi:hypothetical protein
MFVGPLLFLNLCRPSCLPVLFFHAFTSPYIPFVYFPWATRKLVSNIATSIVSLKFVCSFVYVPIIYIIVLALGHRLPRERRQQVHTVRYNCGNSVFPAYAIARDSPPVPLRHLAYFFCCCLCAFPSSHVKFQAFPFKVRLYHAAFVRTTVENRRYCPARR